MKVLSLCALCVLGMAGAASADVLVNPTMEPGEIGIDALILTNGEWTYGPLMQDPNNDWWTSGTTYLIRENWGGGFGRSVDFAMGADSDGRSQFPIGIQKDVTNSTDFVWTGFAVLIKGGVGSTISDVAALPNSSFDLVNIVDNGDGSFLIEFGIDSGTGVALGDNTILNFDFKVDGAIDFLIVQTPIPTPGSIALLSVAGLVASRRKR